MARRGLDFLNIDFPLAGKSYETIPALSIKKEPPDGMSEGS